MRALRDVDLHRPATRRRRRVELPNPAVHIPSAAHQIRAPTTHRTNTCLQSHQRNHHYRDCLYNIRHNTEHKYINFGLFEDATCSEPNPNCNPSALFCTIPGTSAPLPASKRPYRPWPTSTGPPVNAHGIHHPRPPSSCSPA